MAKSMTGDGQRPKGTTGGEPTGAPTIEFETQCNARLIETWRAALPQPLRDQDGLEDHLREELWRGACELIDRTPESAGVREINPRSIAEPGMPWAKSYYTVLGVYPDPDDSCALRRFARCYLSEDTAGAEALAISERPALLIAAVLAGDLDGISYG